MMLVSTYANKIAWLDTKAYLFSDSKSSTTSVFFRYFGFSTFTALTGAFSFRFLNFFRGFENWNEFCACSWFATGIFNSFQLVTLTLYSPS